MQTLKFKKDPSLLAFAALLVLVTAALVAHHDISWQAGAAFLTGALAMPGLFGKSEEPEEDEGKPPPPGPPAWLVLLLLGTTVDVACASASPRDKAREAEERYRAEQVTCAATGKSREAIAECRAKVRERWNVADPKAGVR